MIVYALVVSFCQMVAIDTDPSFRACHSPVTVWKGEANERSCTNAAQMIIAQYKGGSQFADDKWFVGAFSCESERHL